MMTVLFLNLMYFNNILVRVGNKRGKHFNLCKKYKNILCFKFDI